MCLGGDSTRLGCKSMYIGSKSMHLEIDIKLFGGVKYMVYFRFGYFNKSNY